MLCRPLAVLLLAALLPSQDPAAIEAAAARLVGHADLSGGRVGLLVADAGTGTVLYQHDADKGFLTASNMKLVSGAVALLTLGGDFRFETRLETGATVEGGVVKGDVLLIGGGDPTLGGRHESSPLAPFERMAELLRGQGITEIQGRIVGVDDCQDDEALGMGWQWDYLSEDYAAAFSGLCFHENMVRVAVAPTAVGEKPAFRIEPHVGYVLVWSELRCGEAGSPTVLHAERIRNTNTIRITGTIAADAKEQVLKLSVENPTRYAAASLRAALVGGGIKVTGPAVDRDDSGGPFPTTTQVLASEQSRTLREILLPTLKDSVNVYAEQLYRTAARTVMSRSDSRTAADFARDVLQGLGVDVAGMVLADGCGLSRRNLVQPMQIGRLLTSMWQGSQRDDFLACLPVAGIDGTLASRYPAGPARARVRAKTGYIAHVVALSGYVPRQAEGAPPLVFVALLNNFTCETDKAKAAVDAFVGELATLAGWEGK